MAGAAYQITPGTALTLGYRYFFALAISESDIPTSVNVDAQSHELLLGLRFSF